jgi:hypothetical protein
MMEVNINHYGAKRQRKLTEKITVQQAKNIKIGLLLKKLKDLLLTKNF